MVNAYIPNGMALRWQFIETHVAGEPLTLFSSMSMLGFGSNSIGVPTGSDAEKYMKAHELLKSPRMSQVLNLKSNEVITFAEVGDQQGIPVVFIPGPCSNRFIIGLYSDVCTELGVRLVCFDRPGRGGSSPLKYPKEWSFHSYGEYLNEVTDLLNMPKFYVIAHSFGCSYALSCYEDLKHKIKGAFRFMAAWAPSNLPCMPTSYSIQRSMPTKMLRAITAVTQSPTFTSLSYQTVPCQMGVIGSRERSIIHDKFAKEILDRLGSEHLGDDFKAYELDWLLALEIQKSFGFTHRGMKCNIKCWHGMDDSIAPLGAAMWMQREMDHFLLYAVEGATHNIHLDTSISKAVFTDICAEELAAKAEQLKEEEPAVSSNEMPQESSNDAEASKTETTETAMADSHAPAEDNVWNT